MSNYGNNGDNHDDQQVHDKKDLDPIGVSDPMFFEGFEEDKGPEGTEDMFRPSTFKRVMYWFRDVVRGENKTGEVLADVKDVILPIFPLGDTLGRVTDYVGEELRGEGNIGKLLGDLKRKLKEPSTYQGLAVIAGSIGIGVDPSAAYPIGSAVGTIVGTIQVIRKDKDKSEEEEGA